MVVQSSAASAVTIDFDGSDDSLLSTVSFDTVDYSNSLVPASSGSQSSNTINVTATDVNKPLGIVAGGYIDSASDTRDVTDNTVNITGGTIAGNIFGGVINAGDGNVTGNIVTVAAPAVLGSAGDGINIRGGNGYGDVSGNSVIATLDRADRVKAVIGGLSESGAVRSNVVELNVTGAPTTSISTVAGGFSGVGDAVGNAVLIDGTGVFASIIGGWNDAGGRASGNQVVFNGGTVTDGIFGAIAGVGADGNILTINGGTIDVTGDFLAGGLSNGFSSRNTLNINGGTVKWNGRIEKPIAGGAGIRTDSNNVNISGGAVTGIVTGGTSNHDTTNNTVRVTGGVISNPSGIGTSQFTIAGGFQSAFSSDTTAINSLNAGNRVIIEGGAVTGSVYGGLSSSALKTQSNSVELLGGVVSGSLVGGAVVRKDTDTKDLSGAQVSGNSVTIDGGTVAGDVNIYGGQLLTTGKIQTIRDSVVSNNKVTLKSGRVEADLVGGVADSQKPMINVKLTDNTVELFGGTLVGGVEGGRALVGGVVVTDGSVDTFSGNRLVVGGIVRGDNGASIEFVRNFQDIEFRLTQQMLNGEVLLSTRDVVDLTPDGKQVRITLAGNIGGGPSLGIGESLTLMDNVKSNNPNIVQGSQTVSRGIAALDVFDLKLIPGGTNGNNKVTATLHQTVTNPSAGNVASGHVTAFLGLSDANTFAATRGMSAFLDTSKGPGRWTVFAVGSSGRSKYDSIEMDGGHGLLGLGNSWMLPKGLLSVAVFGEMAKYSYDSQALQMRSSGDSELAGGGLMGRFHWNNGLYLEAMGRAGRAKFDYASHDFGLPTAVTYSEEAHYTGASFGGGVENTYTGGLKMNAYLKYLYNRLDGVNVKLAGDDVRFGEITTQAGLAGIQLSRSFGSVTPYGIAEVERVVNVKSRNVANGLRMENPEDLGGNTYIGTLGVRYNPASNWGADVKVSGFGGSRKRGYSANLSMEYKF